VAADVWSATSFNELRREAQDTHRWNLLHPDKKQKTAYEMLDCDWSSDVCSSDLQPSAGGDDPQLHLL
jgi:pyruvate dehydrogenase complex dehydrogenase (E1) component